MAWARPRRVEKPAPGEPERIEPETPGCRSPSAIASSPPADTPNAAVRAAGRVEPELPTGPVPHVLDEECFVGCQSIGIEAGRVLLEPQHLVRKPMHTDDRSRGHARDFESRTPQGDLSPASAAKTTADARPGGRYADPSRPLS
jgi:hypothetical protein